jgi:hypothetical protein
MQALFERQLAIAESGMRVALKFRYEREKKWSRFHHDATLSLILAKLIIETTTTMVVDHRPSFPY